MRDLRLGRVPDGAPPEASLMPYPICGAVDQIFTLGSQSRTTRYERR
jgi:hypothetical protein